MTLEQEILIQEAKAREEERNKVQQEIAKNLKDNGVDLSVIVKSTGLSEEIVEKL